MIALAAALLGLSAPAAGTDPVAATRLIRAAQPCSAVKISQKTPFGNAEIGLNELQDAEVHLFDARLFGDGIALEADATISCRTPDDALVTGDATARLKIAFNGSLDGCEVRTLTVDITETGGRFAKGVEAIRPAIETRLESRVRNEFLSACRELEEY